ncbi:MAG: molecular chaperone DnaJ [Actinobacteria bacterium]|nr:molecular chaperone DnaJ [Actinomycetota bacterium]
MATLYETLGVSKSATDDEIRKAYRTLARRHHPDANPDDPSAEERFKTISHAHDVLSDAAKRRQYDAEQSMFRMGGRPGGPGPGGPGGFSGGFGDVADILGSMFGGIRGKGRAANRAPRRGDDLEVTVTVSFEQAMKGAQVPVAVETSEACRDCRGTGSRDGAPATLCPECNGRGVRGRNLGGFEQVEPCPRCGGAGTVIEDPCPTCSGTGRTGARKRYRVRIPPGAKDGTRIRLKGKGGPAPAGGTPGDLDVVARVTPSARYQRDGDDLTLDVPVTFAEVALGAKVQIPTIDGPIMLNIPAGSEAGKLLRVRGKGAPHLNGEGRGDLIARLVLKVPTDLSASQRKALQAFADMAPVDPRVGLFDRSA